MKTSLPRLILGCFLWFAGVCHAAAESPNTTSGGLRVSYQSYYVAETEAVIDAAIEEGRIQGYDRVQAAGNGFSKWLKGGENAVKPKQRAVLEKGETDALVFGMWWSSVGRWYGATGEQSSMNRASGWGVQNNPEFRLLWQTHWATLMSHIQDKTEGRFLALNVVTPHHDKARKRLETEIDFVNRQHGRRVVVIIPVVSAVLKLREMVADGTFPGVSEQSELFIPGTWNGHRHVRMLVAYCNFAALYGVSPEGLSPSVDHLKYKAKGGDSSSMAGITAEQHAILQKLAWETVSKDAYAGISPAHPNPRATKERHPELNKDLDVLIYDLGKGVQLKLVKVPARGKTFTIGSSEQEQEAVEKRYYNGKRPGWMDFENAHAITLTDDYFIGQYEVTRGQFRRFVKATGYITEAESTDGGYGWNEDEKKFEGRDKKYSWKHYGLDSYTDASPVINITRKDARAFCKWLEDMGAGDGPALELRLPAEAEWEFACRAGGRGRFCFGDGDETLAQYANLADGTRKAMFPKAKGIEAKDGHVFAAPVGQFRPNAFGLYDMHGNVWEWCEDFYGKYAALPSERNGLQSVNQGERRPVMRGGAWYTGPGACRSAYRRLVGIGGRYGSGGFRVVCIPVAR